MTAKLTLTATVPPVGEEPMVVECDNCENGVAHTMLDETEIGQPPGSSGIPCPDCKGTGSRAVRYEVVAPVDNIRVYFKSEYDTEYTVWHYKGRFGSGNDVKEAVLHLATKFVQAHRSGETLSGVTVTEIPEATK